MDKQRRVETKIWQFWEELNILIDKYPKSSPKYIEKWQKNNYAR